jgi:cytidylate kinase
LTRPRQIEQLLERQARAWQMRRKLAGEGGEAARKALVHLQEGPWISISRQWASGGLQMAVELGRRLGWQVYDREILIEMARHAELREAILSRVEERSLDTFGEYIAHLVTGDPVRPAYAQEMMQVVWGLARQGQAVIIGRGANWFLEPAFGLRVRVVAPFERRVARLVEHDGMDDGAARTQTREDDAQRKDFVHKLFGRDIDDPLGYDMVVNLGDIDEQTAADMVQSALRAKLHAAG